MPEVFINYRTIDGKEAAYTFYNELTRRFGEGKIFLAAPSIEAGADYSDALHKGVRRSSVLLALIGDRWLDAPDKDRPETRALDNEKDWVRREIEDAFEYGVEVIPILLGRKTEQLDPGRLPGSLARLAEHQYMRYTLRSAQHDLALIGDQLAKRVPELGAADEGPPDGAAPAREPDSDEPDAPESGAMRTSHQRGGIGNISGFSGNVGNIIAESHGPLHTGSGNIFGAHSSDDADHGDSFRRPRGER
ncbi:toll/interleukin-1 receptor domain-containing protein [Streptomyces sp. PT12]|uniref:toll/interleukin-1 receptor domain-containing protein n=1 Tax=Streptomyces sp. PT12 TaxID=1510197 RepID=UPI000DE41E20|nr:toll/interleukin-1 receptor domain-containing protein [Streptomyces sp. PT12]RBM18549.1 TIR domain-containing protein [Streptomyces sp. PT12]